MNRDSKRRHSSGRHLTEDLLPEILSRLPVKLLLQFRCVSNSWLTCIDDPKFARLQFTRYKTSGNCKSHLIAQIYSNSSSEFELWSSKTLKTASKLESQSSSSYGFKYEMVICMYDGLLILSDLITDQVIIWNPSIRKTRLIPKCSEIHRRMFVRELGFGFNPATDDYNYVIMAHTAKTGLEFFAVYSLGSNSWKTIGFQSQSSSPFSCSPVGRTKRVCARGVLYAITEGSKLNVVSFDLESERFGCFSLPDDDDPTRFIHGAALLTLGEGGRSLGVAQVEDGEGCIWVRQATNWVKRFRFGFSVPCDVTTYYTWFEMNFELLFTCDAVLTFINFHTKEEKIVEKNCDDVIGVWRYTESLLLLN